MLDVSFIGSKYYAKRRKSDSVDTEQLQIYKEVSYVLLIFIWAFYNTHRGLFSPKQKYPSFWKARSHSKFKKKNEK